METLMIYTFQLSLKIMIAFRFCTHYLNSILFSLKYFK